MAIVLNRLNPGNELGKFVDILTKANEVTRHIVYHGITEAIARVYAANSDVTIPRVNLLLEIGNMVRHIGELTIVDKPILEHMLKSKYDHFYNIYLRQDKRNPYEWKTIEDAYGLTSLYSIDDIGLINKNFDLYREAYIVGHDWYTQVYMAPKPEAQGVANG